MRRLMAIELVSVDGVMESPGEWAFSYSDDEMERERGGDGRVRRVAAGEDDVRGVRLLLAQPTGGTQMVDYINSVQKLVVSGTLEEPLEWNNSTLIKGDVAEEIARLKRQPGKNITITGSVTLVRSLIRARLLDELRLMVHPVILANGKRLFEDGGHREVLELVGSKSFSTGVVSLTYRPSSEQGS
jgi:dihydrofolate reductase